MIVSRRSVLGLLAAPVLITPGFAQAGDRLQGYWRGQWRNNLGQSGNDSLVLTEYRNGQVVGMWTGSVQVSGYRYAPNAATLTGRHKGKAYEIDVVAYGGYRLQLRYQGRSQSSGEVYHGQSLLQRAP